ncbi:M20/M25/M40 family metallo-hydrolase [Methanobrevibacter curvatus]|uniref:Peptidase T n=1 Tax=Methanobrevibacter curvatus TaxID=49547 RepID=A0A166DK99_9EURY|nr:M20/M25/M40 family metallo-hydrolase [Methanobrevibacter curvatus]KZX15684.1 peptidase T [Methanobrevibacter curvatus]
MDKERLLRTFANLVSIDNPPLLERNVADYIRFHLSELGLEVCEDYVGDEIGGNCGNLYGFFSGDKSLDPILFSLHMDTVEPCIGKKAIFHDDGTISSDGTTVLGADDLTGVAAVIEAITFIKENNLDHRPIELLFFVAEEIYGLGSKYFDYSLLKSKEAYTLDLSGPIGYAAYKAPTLITFEIVVKGKGGHASFKLKNTVHPIAIVSEAINKIKIGNIDGESTLNIGIIEGGFGTNIIPSSCTVKGEVRSFTNEKAIELVEKNIAVFSKTASKYGGEIESDFQIRIESYETPLDHSVVKRFKNACKSIDLIPNLLPTLGGSDNNNIQKNGIYGLVLSSAMNNPHSYEEFTNVKELENITKLVIQLMTSKD